MKANNNQSWLDIAIQYAGDATAAIEYATINNCDFTDAIDDRQEIQPIKGIIDKEVQTYFKTAKLKPASQLTVEQTEQSELGTGLIQIG